MDARVRRTRDGARRPQETTHEETISVRSSAFGVEEGERKVLSVRKFATEPAYVRVNAGTTKNLGNYESLRVDVSVSVPCYTEEIEEVVERVADYVADTLDEELKKYDGE